MPLTPAPFTDTWVKNRCWRSLFILASPPQEERFSYFGVVHMECKECSLCKIPPFTHTHTHARVHTHTHTHTQSHACTHTHMHLCTHTHACTNKHACTNTHTHTHSHAYTHTHTHTHTLPFPQTLLDALRQGQLIHILRFLQTVFHYRQTLVLQRQILTGSNP